MGETTETVLARVKGGSNDPVRVNKSDFDEDQAKPSGDRQYSAYSGKDEPEQSVAGAGLPIGGPPLAAPSAPDFSGPEGGDTLKVDPLKNAAAPVVHGENARLVMKKGSKYVVVDGAGQTIHMDGIDPAGYKTEDGAWTAIRALPH